MSNADLQMGAPVDSAQTLRLSMFVIGIITILAMVATVGRMLDKTGDCGQAR